MNRPIFILLMMGSGLVQPGCVPPKSTVEGATAATDDYVHGFRRKVTIEEAEQKHMVSDPHLGKEPVAFGFIHTEWLKFKRKMLPGDQLMEFYTPPPPDGIHGYGGFEIVRDGKVVDTLLDLM